MSHLTPRTPFVIDIHDLGRGPGSILEVDLAEVAPSGWGNAVIGVTPGSILSAQVRLESVSEGVLASGTVECELSGVCGRCLEPVHSTSSMGFEELFRYARRMGSSGGEEAPFIEGELIDLRSTLLDAIVPALPLAPRCREDCPGLCPECGARIADDPGHRHEQQDPRWAALAGLLDEQQRPSKPQES